MNSKSDREELERRLAQVKRLTDTDQDPLTRERLAALIADIEQQLAGPGAAADVTSQSPFSKTAIAEMGNLIQSPSDFALIE